MCLSSITLHPFNQTLQQFLNSPTSKQKKASKRTCYIQLCLLQNLHKQIQLSNYKFFVKFPLQFGINVVWYFVIWRRWFCILHRSRTLSSWHLAIILLCLLKICTPTNHNSFEIQFRSWAALIHNVADVFRNASKKLSMVGNCGKNSSCVFALNICTVIHSDAMEVCQCATHCM